MRGVALSDDGEEQAGMGIGVGDYDLDGHLDLFKTHFADDANVLYRNDGKGNFDDVTRRSRVGVETRYVCWGAGIVDLDNDGYPDLFMVTGNVYPEVERKLPQYPHRTPRTVFRNMGNQTFEELVEAAGPGVAHTGTRSGCVSARGAFDMVGNVEEWVADWVPRSTACTGWASFSDDLMCLSGASTAGSGPGALTRGGSLVSGTSAGPLAVSGGKLPIFSTGLIGFRCVR